MVALSFAQWSSYTHNGSRFGIVFRRLYWRGYRWTLFVYWWPHRVGKPDA